jgi:hypothetical protein
VETKIRLFADTATDSDATTVGPTDMMVLARRELC